MTTAKWMAAGVFLNVANWLVAGALALGTASAMAGEWSLVAQDGAQIVFVDRSSIRDEGGLKTARVLRSYSTVQTIGDDAFAHKSEILHYAVRCEDRSLGFEAWTLTAGEIGTGDTVWTGQVQDPALYQDPQDPMVAGIIDTTCNT
ncbi:MAG TPA: surface-adhesin E family protein [Burkholderiales bacterium]|nr:surface-adhesin E family protein [Burkholderiales bacterium]